MSRIGAQPVAVEDVVEVSLNGRTLQVKGPKGALSLEIPETVSVAVNTKEGSKEVVVERTGDSKQARSDHGTVRSLISNMVLGVKEGFTKELEVVGMGYRAEMQGETLVLHVGWNHPVKINAPEGISFSVQDSELITVSGIDRQLVGLWAAKIRETRKPEPYKGKGIRYKDEVVRRKTSKSVKE
ncbi:MAG: 50S ribosomal protein L6 [Candidatus Dojkabacteria bacterium]|nr:50S ribosomal protein L6 [Candidatus Dojkabacteria bacterium]